jgi:Na+/melibiose symporter-like transporter
MDRKIVSNISEISTGEDAESGETENKTAPARESKLDWFRMPKFYLFGICYMCVRLYTNLYGTLLPFYLIDVVHMGIDDKDSVSFNLALVPMLTYASSVIVSTQLNWFYGQFGRKKALFVGTAICLICLVGMVFLQEQSNWMMYILALFIGASQSLVLSTGINLISDVVGAKAKTGAFVFGIYSLLDKFSSGIAIFLIGNADSYSKPSDQITPEDVSFIRMSMVLVPGLACLLSSLIVLSYPIEEYKKPQGPNAESLLTKS